MDGRATLILVSVTNLNQIDRILTTAVRDTRLEVAIIWPIK